QETDFFRGIAATYGDRIEITGFYSNRPRTASVINGDTTSFPSSSGFHRTESEIAKRNNVNQQTYGGRFRFDTRTGYWGVSGYSTQFSSFIEKGADLSDLFDFHGRSNSVIGIDYRALIGQSLIFGELARSENSAVGGVAGIQTSISDNADLALLFRNYEKDFQSFLGDGFGERSTPDNERGVYFGVAHQLNHKYRLSGYFDQYAFEAPVSGTTQPTYGYDILGLIEAEVIQDLNAYLLIRSEIKDDEYFVVNDAGREESLLGERKRISIRIQTEYQVSRKIRLRSRGEVVWYQAAGEAQQKGYLMYQDLRVIPNSKFQFDARMTLFDTESFDTRVYQFENDLLYVLSNVALSEQGQRMYVVTKYVPVYWLQLWFKYGVTLVEDAQIISSGLSEIKGNTRSQIGIQVRVLLR
ncbi:MAG: hypothetical protein MI700_01025, partial [Balneolales bacterium]|nr:hypothetical protein [Balneolales bacterium]